MPCPVLDNLNMYHFIQHNNQQVDIASSLQIKKLIFQLVYLSVPTEWTVDRVVGRVRGANKGGLNTRQAQ